MTSSQALKMQTAYYVKICRILNIVLLVALALGAANGEEGCEDLVQEKRYGLELRRQVENLTQLLEQTRRRLYELERSLAQERAANREINVNCRDETTGMTALHRAAQRGRLDAVRLLVLERNAELDLREKEFGRTPLLQATLFGRAEVVRWLAERGANVDARNNQGFSALHYAVWYGHMDICRVLLRAGAEVDARGAEGQTPLMLAARTGHMDSVKLLLHAGAEVSAMDSYGRTAKDWATHNAYTNVAEFLEKAANKVSSSKIKPEEQDYI